MPVFNKDSPGAGTTARDREIYSAHGSQKLPLRDGWVSGRRIQEQKVYNLRGLADPKLLLSNPY